jgi:putative aldouronate transport system substrate-binding protein
MKKSLRRIMPAAVAMLVATSLFSACSQKNTDTSGKTPASSSKESSEETTKTEETKVKTIKIMGPESSNPYIKFSERERYSSWKEFEKLFTNKGLKPEFEVIATDQYQTTLQTRMAAGVDLPDFLNVSHLDDASILGYVDKQTILPINKIIDAYSDGTAKAFFANGKGSRSNTLNTAEDGNVYWISQIQATTYADKPGSTSMGISIRKDWLDALGIQTPKTADDFYNMLKVFREKDANGNGKPDEVLAFDPAGFTNGIAQWFGLVTDISSFIIEDGKVVSPWYQPGIKDYFAYLNKLAKEGLMDTSLVGLTSGDQLDQTISENKAGAIFTYVMQTWYEPSTGIKEAAYQPIGPLKATEAAEPINAIEPPFLSYNRWAFTKDCKDQEAAAALLDILCSEEYQQLTQWGIEGETFEVVNGEKKLLPIALNAGWEQAGKEGKSIGDSLWANGSMFPKRRFVPMENEISVVPDYKAEYQKAVIDYHPTTPLGNSNYFPVPTQEQVQRRLEIITDLRTQSTQLATQLILGQISLDDWDKHIESLKSLGLDEIIAIDQTLLDRYNAGSK